MFDFKIKKEAALHQVQQIRATLKIKKEVVLNWVRHIPFALKIKKTTALRQARRIYAIYILQIHKINIRLVAWRQLHGFSLFVAILGTFFLISMLLESDLQNRFGKFFVVAENFSALKSFLAGTGSALVGATAIAFSLILFAMQVNVERMPHGMFKRLSSDKLLLGSFLISFMAALAVGASSLISKPQLAMWSVMIAAWGTLLILLLFIAAYRRALLLINPAEQLSISVKYVSKELRKWHYRAKHADPLIREEKPEAFAENIKVEGTPFDAVKAAFLKVNPHWDNDARQAIQYAISYAQRFASIGDHEVTAHAFKSVMLINATYCAVKNGAFISDRGFFDGAGSTDGFINTTLEHYRQTMRVALSKGDEQLAEHTLRGISSLIAVYVKIDYSGIAPSKTHAKLAAGYLQSAVESVVPHNMPDVLMEGIRIMGRIAKMFLAHAKAEDIIFLSEKIALLSFVGVIRSDHQAVTLTAFEQLSEITIDLIVSGKGKIDYPVKQLRLAVTDATKRFLEAPGACQIFCVSRGREIIPKGKFHDRHDDHT